MKVVLVKTGQKAEITEIGDKLEDMQEVVEGYIEAVYPFDDPVALVCNEDGKLNGSPWNRVLYNDEGKIYDVVYGTFFICGLGEEDFTSISDELAEKYADLFNNDPNFVRWFG